jgi:hypothetical protein
VTRWDCAHKTPFPPFNSLASADFRFCAPQAELGPPRARAESLPHKGNDGSACSGNMSHLVCVCFYKQDSIRVQYGGTRPISVLRSSTRPGLARVRE